MASTRRSYESKALKHFTLALEEKGISYSTGQKASNRIGSDPLVAFQFGDLRVSRGNTHLVVEAESAGGVTNLAKYWLLMKNGEIGGYLHLYHLFYQDTPNSYRSHLDLWDFLRDQMTVDLDGRFSAQRVSYFPGKTKKCVASAVADFVQRAEQVAASSA